MDPDRAWIQLINAIDKADLDEALAIARDLHEWLSRGGFPPKVIQQLGTASRDICSVAYRFQHELAIHACAYIISLD
jgi:N-acetylglutamate synthase-like GNAT family acetyltransferase